VGLEPLAGGSFRIGYVDMVNGQGAIECPQYRPTYYELRQIAKYWYLESLDHNLFCFVHSVYGSDWSRIMAYANRRLARLGKVLGEEAMQEVLGEAKKEVCERFNFNDREWAIFERGDSEECRAFQEEYAKKMGWD
jgi:hypothetical protein